MSTLNQDKMKETDNKQKILNIDNIDIITNGSLEDLSSTNFDPNQVGKVVNRQTNEKVSDITPMIIIINQGRKDLHKRVNILIEKGGNMDLQIDYYGKNMTAREILEKYRQ